jgi:formyltetrahydrofolate deformylase
MSWQIHDAAVRMPALILVSKFGHCLNDLLFRHSIGALPIDIPAVVSNHTDFQALVESYGIPFVHLPVTKDNKAEQEAHLLRLVEERGVELVVLARYMQVLSDEVCKALEGRIVNIHHSFLPSFKGAKPYHQAHTRGVKLIGATAHYVTADLDEGPIIEQDVARVGHGLTPDQLVALGRDVECRVLSRAVAWHSEHRVLLNGRRTVVFP